MSKNCIICGHEYKMDLMVPDCLWKKISPKNANGLVCPSCIVKKVEVLEIKRSFRLVVK